MTATAPDLNLRERRFLAALRALEAHPEGLTEAQLTAIIEAVR